MCINYGGIFMPATITHAYFAKDIYDVLPKSIKEHVSLSRVKMFGQSSDPLMFYNLFSLKPGKEIRELDKTLHSTKSRKFFINLVNYIKMNDLSKDSDVSSFLVGQFLYISLRYVPQINFL